MVASGCGSKKEDMSTTQISSCLSRPLTILAVDAPNMGAKRVRTYNKDTLRAFARKVFFICRVADVCESPRILTGLLGGGAFRNNRPLVLLLHMLMQLPDRVVIFHHPVFWSYSRVSTDELEQLIVQKADEMMGRLRSKEVKTLEDALTEIETWQLPLSSYDGDLVDTGSRIEQDPRARCRRGR